MTHADPPSATAGAAEPATSPQEPTGPLIGGRVRSVDVTRGTVVGLSAVLSHLPASQYGFAAHADWHGLTLLDFILPGFMTLFGVGMAFAYRRRVPWRRVARRTVVLLAFGLVFNAVVGWDATLGTWRLTGVLQAFAISGLVVTALAWATRRWQALATAGLAMLAVQGAILWSVASRCADGLPTPDCNPSGIVDPAVFGADHIYRQGTAGFDPEGLGVLLGVTGTVALGAAAGRWFSQRRAAGRHAYAQLAGLGVALLALAVLAAAWLPVNKSVWTPAYGLLTAGTTVLLLAGWHLLLEGYGSRPGAGPRRLHRAVWLPEAFGRNSLLVYFGKYMLVAVMANLALTSRGTTLWGLLQQATAATPRPGIAQSAVMVAFWAIVAALLHRRGWYLRA